MSDDVTTPEPDGLRAFVEQYMADWEDGGPRPLAEYLERFPDDRAGITREYLALERHLGPPPADDAPDHFGPYRLVRELGRGGQAKVWLAEDPRLDRSVALKVLDGIGPLSTSALRRFEREARVASQLDHPAICSVYEAGTEGGVPFIAMRHVDGPTLAQVIAGRDRPGDVDDDVDLVARTADALQAAHEKGVVHRDVKPGNVLVTEDGDPVVVDFGLARSAREDEALLTHTGDVFGTPHYMAPEQIRGEPVDARADVWALGATLFEMLTGRRPFDAPTRELLARRILGDEPPNLQRVRSACGRDLAVVVSTALQKDLARRYQSAKDLADDLRRVVAKEPVLARPVSWVGRVVRWTRRRPAAAAMIALAVVSLALGGFMLAKWDAFLRGEAVAAQERAETALEDGFLELGKGSPAKARTAFAQALEHVDELPEAVMGTALAWLREGDAERAIAVLDGDTELERDHPDMRRIRAEALRRSGKESQAQSVEAGLGEPRDALGFFVTGLTLMLDCKRAAVEDWKAAHRHLQQAVLLSSRPIYHFELAHALGHLRDGDFGERLARSLEMRWGDSHVAAYWAGFLRQHTRPEAALDAYDRCIADRPDFLAAWFGRARALSKLEKREEAIAALRRCLEIEPQPVIHYNLAYNLERLGDDEGAERHYRATLDLNDGIATAWLNLGLLLQRHGRPGEALPMLERGHAIGSKAKGWPFESDAWVAACRDEVQPARRLDAWTASGGGPVPADADLVVMAHLAFRRGAYAASSDLYRRAYEKDPGALDALPTDQAKRLLAEKGLGAREGPFWDRVRARAK